MTLYTRIADIIKPRSPEQMLADRFLEVAKEARDKGYNAQAMKLEEQAREARRWVRC